MLRGCSSFSGWSQKACGRSVCQPTRRFPERNAARTHAKKNPWQPKTVTSKRLPDYSNHLIPAEVTFVIPNPTDKRPVEVFRVTATAAEAEQQRIMASPAFSKACLSSSSFRDLMEAYAAVQQSYHRAMAFHLARHEALAGSSAALAYAMLCEFLGREPSKQAGDRITSVELQQLATDAARSPRCRANAAKLNLAEALTNQAMNSGDNSLIALVMENGDYLPSGLAMPSIVDALVWGYAKQGTFVANVLGDIVSFAAGSSSSGARQCMEDVLLALAEQGGPQRPNVGDGYPPYAMMIMGTINRASP